jgi:GAF domain-containing protein
MTGRSFLDRKPVHVRDLLSAEGAEFPNGQKLARSVGFRTMLTVPLLREGESIGVIMLRRKEVQPFGEKQIVLLQTFANQAVIAIGNVRMFEQVQAKTRDRGAAAADSDFRGIEGYLQFAWRTRTCVPLHAGERCKYLRCPVRQSVPR